MKSPVEVKIDKKKVEKNIRECIEKKVNK